jgi:hypothetical protein
MRSLEIEQEIRRKGREIEWEDDEHRLILGVDLRFSRPCADGRASAGC